MSEEISHWDTKHHYDRKDFNPVQKKPIFVSNPVNMSSLVEYQQNSLPLKENIVSSRRLQ